MMDDLFLLALEDQKQSIESDLEQLQRRVGDEGLGNLDFEIIANEIDFMAHIVDAKNGLSGKSLPHIAIFDHLIEKPKKGFFSFLKQPERIKIIPEYVKKTRTIHPGCVCVGLSGVMTKNQSNRYVTNYNDPMKYYRDGLLYDFIPKGNADEVVNRLLEAVRFAVDNRRLFNGGGTS